jgi:hypothetical protein
MSSLTDFYGQNGQDPAAMHKFISSNPQYTQQETANQLGVDPGYVKNYFTNAGMADPWSLQNSSTPIFTKDNWANQLNASRTQPSTAYNQQDQLAAGAAYKAPTASPQGGFAGIQAFQNAPSLAQSVQNTASGGGVPRTLMSSNVGQTSDGVQQQLPGGQPDAPFAGQSVLDGYKNMAGWGTSAGDWNNTRALQADQKKYGWTNDQVGKAFGFSGQQAADHFSKFQGLPQLTANAPGGTAPEGGYTGADGRYYSARFDNAQTNGDQGYVPGDQTGFSVYDNYGSNRMDYNGKPYDIVDMNGKRTGGSKLSVTDHNDLADFAKIAAVMGTVGAFGPSMLANAGITTPAVGASGASAAGLGTPAAGLSEAATTAALNEASTTAAAAYGGSGAAASSQVAGILQMNGTLTATDVAGIVSAAGLTGTQAASLTAKLIAEHGIATASTVAPVATAAGTSAATSAATKAAAAAAAAGTGGGKSGGLNLGGLGLGDIANLLSGINDRNKQGKAADEMLKYLREQQAKVDNLYGKDSPETALLRQTMERKDAAAGRNSQYGPREVDLAAKIAEIKANNTAKMTTGIGSMYAAALNQNASRDAGLSASLGKMFNGGGAGGGGSLMDIINSLFGHSGGGNSAAEYVNQATQPSNDDTDYYSQ